MSGGEEFFERGTILCEEHMELARKIIEDPFSHRVKNEDGTLRQWLIRAVACEEIKPPQLLKAEVKVAEARSQGITGE